MRDRVKFLQASPDRIKNHLFVFEELELLTQKEYHKLKEKALPPNDNSKHELERLITDSTDSKSIGRVQEFMKMLLQEKDQIFECLIRLPPDRDEMLARLDKGEEIINICHLLADIDNLYRIEKPIFDETTFREWYDSLLRQSKYGKSYVFYKKLHIKQKTLLLKVVKKNLIRVSEMSKWLYKPLKILSKDKNTENIQKEVRDIIQAALYNDMLNRFYKDNVKADSDLSTLKFLSESDSPYYSEKSYKRLEPIINRAGKEM